MLPLLHQTISISYPNYNTNHCFTSEQPQSPKIAQASFFLLSFGYKRPVYIKENVCSRDQGKAPDVIESNMKAPTSEGRALPADKEPGMRMNDGAPTTSREESMDCKSESRLKHGLKRGVQSRVNGFRFMQYEGATFEDGKGPRIWDTFAHQFLGKITNKDNGDVGDGFYHCYKPMPNFTSSTLCVDQLLHYVEDVKM
uniref:Beta-glucosidase 12-like n=1 Tax=Tanacetum cinerariifolium TaxID=118510 RepID=A0A6L2NDS8_TANCI|nr:beta-glucosidase 12-like [Tanacetum cinerariifolium]